VNFEGAFSILNNTPI